MKTRLTYAALGVSLLGCLVFAYLWIDRSISLTYAIQSADAGGAATRSLQRLLESSWSGMPESEVLAMLQTAADRFPSEIIVKEQDGVIWFDDTRFGFEDGKLKSVTGP